VDSVIIIQITLENLPHFRAGGSKGMIENECSKELLRRHSLGVLFDSTGV
jgi:hypothetical protein